MEHQGWHQPVPPSWNAFGAIDGSWSVRDVADAVSRIGSRSDEIVRALVSLPAIDAGPVVEVMVLAAHSLLHRRCARNPALSADELATELVLVTGQARRDGLPVTSRRLLNVLVDQAWGQYRLPFRRHRLDVIHGAGLIERVRDNGRQPEDVLDGVALCDFRRWLAADPRSRRGLVRCWNSSVELASREHRTEADQDRYKYVRAQLRRVAPPELVQ